MPPPKKKPRQYKQPNLFSLGNQFPITQKKLDKQRRVVSSFVRKEDVAVGEDPGVYKAVCEYCGREFINSQGLGNHLKFCAAAKCT